MFGKTRALKDLSPQQAAALNLSEDRLATFDRALQVLDERRARHLVSAREYEFQRNDLVGFIANEAQFQNAILVKESVPFELFPEKVVQGLEEAAAILGYLVIRVGGPMLQSVHT